MSSFTSSGKAGVYVPPGRRSPGSSSSAASAVSWRRSASPPSALGSGRSSRTSSPPGSRPSSSSSSGSQPAWDAPKWERGRSLSSLPSMPRFEDLQEGMVFFLPEPPKSSRMQVTIAGTGQNPWRHPVVVTDKRAVDGENCVEIRLCTSFGDQRITSTDKKPHQYNMFVLADNNIDTVPHGYTRLAGLIVGSAKFPKRTYVNLSKDSTYEIEYDYLTPWDKGPIQFDKAAMARIKARCPY